jgi:hypothetical protein
MASGHGAGLMAVPFVPAGRAPVGGDIAVAATVGDSGSGPARVAHAPPGSVARVPADAAHAGGGAPGGVAPGAVAGRHSHGTSAFGAAAGDIAVAASPGVHHAAHRPGGAAGRGRLALLATIVHTLGYLLATGTVAAIVYYRVGLRMLRRAWINVDLIWAGSLIVTALVIPLM